MFRFAQHDRTRSGATPAMSDPTDNQREKTSLVRALGPIDATMIVIGSMIGPGIFIVSAESSRLSGAPGWLLLAWALAGLLTMTGALCCSELATMMARAGADSRSPRLFRTHSPLPKHAALTAVVIIGLALGS